MIDLTMWRRADGMTLEKATAGESTYLVLSYTPDPNLDPEDIRVIVLRWPFLVTVAAVLVFMLTMAMIGETP